MFQQSSVSNVFLCSSCPEDCLMLLGAFRVPMIARVDASISRPKTILRPEPWHRSPHGFVKASKIEGELDVCEEFSKCSDLWSIVFVEGV